MPLINHLKLYGELVAPHLEPGEGLLDMGPFRVAYGDRSEFERPPELVSGAERWLRRSAGLPEPRPRERRKGWITGFDPLAGVEWNTDRISRALSGTAVSGSATSVTAQLLVAEHRSPGLVHYAITDRRFLLLRHRGVHAFDLLLAVPRSAIAEALVKSKPLPPQRGRVVLRFVDGSQLALLAAMFGKGRARRLTAALSGA